MCEKSILVLGSTGMLGHVLYEYLRQFRDFDVYRTSREKKDDFLFFDVLDESSFSLFESRTFDYIVNCIGILVSESESDLDKAYRINRDLPLFLESRFAKSKTKIIHISTDCVFKGDKGSSYTTEDLPDAEYNYGVSKRGGEFCNSKDVTIRTSIIGPDLNPKGSGLFNWFMSVREETEIKGFSKAFWTGVSTIELSTFIAECINADIKGLVHFSKPSKISKFELLNLFKERSEASVRIERDDLYSVDKSLTPSEGCVCPNPYEKMVDVIFDWIESKNHLYPHYTISKENELES